MNRKPCCRWVLGLLSGSFFFNSVLASPPPLTVETLPSGVRVEHQVQGTGKAPNANSMVKVHYRGTLDDGTEFDSSIKRNRPVMFGLYQVIPCWTQGVQKMKEGGSAKLVCPAETAYGSRSAGKIPANSRLTFEIQLLAVE